MADPSEGGGEPAEFVLAPAFKWVFIGVMLLTLVAFSANIALAIIFENPSPALTEIINTCSTTYKMGFGAVAGLLGGKRITS